MRVLFAVLFAVLLVMAIIPHTDIFAAKPSKFKVKVDDLKGSKTITLPDGRTLERSVHIFYKQDFAKPSGVGGGKGDTCYSFLAKGAKWKTAESYMVDPNNAAGLDPAFVTSTTAASLNTWNGQ